ncbi:MAG: GNAT family N-acetyltransferase [Alphaproteobacteria bacterium]|nr:GNAT family N-acetyltransferase [Alphaproteobacteria bacterium]
MSAGRAQEIRPARPADVPRIRAIVDAAYEKYVPRIGKKPGPMLDDYGKLVAGRVVWVLEDEGAVAGLVVLLPEPDHVLLDNVAVDPAKAGRGIGRALIAFAEAETRRRGFGDIRLYTHEKMTENIAMYPRLGYEETHRGEQAGYSRVFMRKKLA